MKKIIFIIILISSSLYSQHKDCCDSIKKENQEKHSKTIKKIALKDKGEISITIDNSNRFSLPAKDHICENDLKIEKEKQKESNFNWNELYKNLITIFLGLVAGFIALYQMKSNIISSARIRWIEDLRDSLSKFYTVSLDVINSYENFDHAQKMKKPNEDEHYNSYDSNMTKFNILMNKIKMLLNSNETEHKNIENIIDKIDDKLNTINTVKVTQEEIEKDLKEIVLNSKIIFKKEWEKSKKLFEI